MAAVASRKNIYIRDDDQELLERFESKGGNSSELFSKALRRQEAEKSSKGHWLLRDFISAADPIFRWHVQLTERNTIVVIASIEGLGWPRPLERFSVHKTLEAAQREGAPKDVIAAAKAARKGRTQ